MEDEIQEIYEAGYWFSVNIFSMAADIYCKWEDQFGINENCAC